MRILLFLSVVLCASVASAQPGQDPPPPPPVSDIVITAAVQEPITFQGVPADACSATVAIGNHEGAEVRVKIWATNGLILIPKIMFDGFVPTGVSVKTVTWIAADNGVGSFDRASHYTAIAAIYTAAGNEAATDTRDTEVQFP